MGCIPRPAKWIYTFHITPLDQYNTYKYLVCTSYSLRCLYCERTFRDHVALKDHMRKKQHKKINPQNKIYDRFYVINYLELGKSWEQVQSEDDREIIEREDK